MEIKNAELEQDRNDDGEENAVALKEENERLDAANEEMAKKLEKLQKDVVIGTGSEELLQELQNEINNLVQKTKS